MSVAGRIFKREEAPLSAGNVSIAGRIFKREEVPLSVGNVSIAGRIFKREEAPLSVGNVSIAGRIFKREEAPLSAGNFLLDLCFLLSGNTNILEAEQEKHSNTVVTSNGHLSTCLSPGHFSRELPLPLHSGSGGWVHQGSYFTTVVEPRISLKT